MLLSRCFARLSLHGGATATAAAQGGRMLVHRAPMAAPATALPVGAASQLLSVRGYFKARNGGYFGKVNRKDKEENANKPPKPKAPPKETIEQMNDRIFGKFPAYQEAKATGSESPVLDALGVEQADPEMLKLAMKLAEDVLPVRTGPRRSRFRKRQRLKQVRKRARHGQLKRERIAAHERKRQKQREKKAWQKTLLEEALETERAWQEEKAARRAQRQAAAGAPQLSATTMRAPQQQSAERSE